MYASLSSSFHLDNKNSLSNEEKDAKEDVILPPDVLDTSLAMLCAPLTVTHAKDLRGREAHFGCPAVTVRLRNTDVEVMEALKGISANTPGGGLSVTVLLDESVTELIGFMGGCNLFRRVDFRQTSLRKIGSFFLYA